MSSPTRIVSLISSATEMLFGIGLGDRVVAVSHECDWPAEVSQRPRATRANIDDRVSSLEIDQQVKAKLAAGAPLYEVDEQLLCDLQPDLIVTQAQCDVCAVKYEEVAEAVARHKELSNTTIVTLNPMSLFDVLDDIVRIGRAADAEPQAVAYRERLARRVEAIRTQALEISAGERRRAALIEWIEPLMISGNWMPAMVRLAGGEHALTTAGRPSSYLPPEQFIAYDPEVVLVLPCGFDLKRTIVEAAPLASMHGWTELAAVRDRRVYAVDGNQYFNRSGPRLVDSLEILAHLVYPERFGVPACVDDPRAVWTRLETAGESLTVGG